MLNSVQAYITTIYARRVYLAKPAETTALSARIFGSWSLLSSIVRLYAVYDISNPQLYQLALSTYVIAFAHFMAEWFIFGTAKWGPGIASTAFVSTASLVWMLTQWSFYNP